MTFTEDIIMFDFLPNLLRKSSVQKEKEQSKSEKKDEAEDGAEVGEKTGSKKSAKGRSLKAREEEEIIKIWIERGDDNSAEID